MHQFHNYVSLSEKRGSNVLAEIQRLFLYCFNSKFKTWHNLELYVFPTSDQKNIKSGLTKFYVVLWKCPV